MNNKPRRPWLAALLTILRTGLGHIYSGNLKRGLLLFCIGQLLSLSFFVSLVVITPNASYMIFAILVGFVFTIYCIADAALIATKHKKNYELAEYNRWFVYVGYFMVTGLLVQMFASFVMIPYWIQAYKIPTGSMEPTLLIGDHILVNKHIYNIDGAQTR